jgi:hypothetical protein
MFLSSKSKDLFYSIIVDSCHKSAEIYLKKKLEFKKIVIKNNYNVYFFLYIFILIFSGLIFIKKIRIYLTFRGIEIGRFITASVYRDYNSYFSKTHFYKNFIYKLYSSGKIFKTADLLLKEKFECVYLDHCGYLNGILYSIFSNNNKIIFTNNYPKSIYGIDFKKKTNFSLKKYEHSLKLSKYELPNKNFLISRNILKKLTKKNKILPWMSETKFSKFKNSKMNQNVDYVIYAHSFTDGQLWFGNDDFENSYDWLEFTLNFFKDKDKKILIKAHPNFFNKNLGDISFYDKKIFNILVNKFGKIKNFCFLNEPILNSDLLNYLNNKTIAITHHGSVTLELAFLGLKSISSNSTFFFSEQFKISNFWKNKEEYLCQLNKNWSELSCHKRDDLYQLTYQLFINDNNFYGKNSYPKVTAKILRTNFKNLYEKNGLFSRNSFNANFFHKKINEKQISNIVNILSRKIKLV